MRKFFMSIAVAGVLLAGCSKNEVEKLDVQNPDAINFITSTSRATVANITTLTGAAGGFKVYAKTADVNNAWWTNVDGTNNYKFDSNWKWAGTDAEWPKTTASYPMEFYAMFPAESPVATPGQALSKVVTIAATAAAQTDLLAAKATAQTKPASGSLSMVFNHILSKVNFGIIAGNGMTVEVQSIGIKNVHSENAYDYIASAWASSTSAVESYNYFRNTATPFSVTGADPDEDTAAAFYTGAAANNAHLMLMPQVAIEKTGSTGAPQAWVPVSKTPPAATVAYIDVVYRVVYSGDDYIGYTNGADYLVDYPAWGEAPNNNPGWPSYTGGLGTNGTTEYNDALYIHVGFPVTIEWKPGKGYTYQICIGTADSNNGYYVDDTYLDKNGDDTGIPIIGPDKDGDGKPDPVEPGESVTTGVIKLLIEVANWEDTDITLP